MKMVGGGPVVARSPEAWDDVAISGRGRCDEDVFGLPTQRLPRYARNDAEEVYSPGNNPPGSIVKGSFTVVG